MFDPEKLKVKLQILPAPSQSNTDMAIWSVRGRYLFASLSGKKAGDNQTEKGVIQIWNSLTN